MPSRRAVPATAAEAVAGIRLALAGLATWARAPRLMLLGALPGFIVAAVLGVGLAVLAVNLGTVGEGIANALGARDGWWASLVAATAAIAVLAASSLVAVALFAGLTLTVGQPFFEAISRRVDVPLPAAVEEPWWPAFRRGVGESVITLGISIAVSVTILVVGLLPVIGSGTAFTLGALLGGRLLAIELTAYPFARRGITSRRARIAALRPLRIRATVFGACVFLLFLLPLGAVLAMPAAVAGATLLAGAVDPATSDGRGGALGLEGSADRGDRGVQP